MGNNLFVVSSPLQLFNALEARDRLHPDDANRLLVIWGSAIDRQQMCVLLDGHWAEVRWLRLRGWVRAAYPLMLARWLAAQRPVSALYIGYPFNVRAHIANVLQAPRTVLIDDGHATIEFARHLASPESRALDNPHLADRMFRRHTGLDYAGRLHIFSVYEELPGWPADRRELNDYRAFKGRIAALPRTDELLFIGTPLAGTVVETAEQELDLLRAMARHYAGLRVRYAAHRYEDLDALSSLGGLPNVQFMRYDTLLEYALYRSGGLPARIATWCSSAVDTLTRIYDLPAEVLRIPDAMVMPVKRPLVNALYSSYAHRNIAVIDVDVSSFGGT